MANPEKSLNRHEGLLDISKRLYYKPDFKNPSNRKDDLYPQDSDHLKNYTYKNVNGVVQKIEDGYEERKPTPPNAGKPILESIGDVIGGAYSNFKKQVYNTKNDWEKWFQEHSVKDLNKYRDAKYESEILSEMLKKDESYYQDADQIVKEFEDANKSVEMYNHFGDKNSIFRKFADRRYDKAKEELSRAIRYEDNVKKYNQSISDMYKYGQDTKLVEFLKFIPGISSYLTSLNPTDFSDTPLWGNEQLEKDKAKYARGEALTGQDLLDAFKLKYGPTEKQATYFTDLLSLLGVGKAVKSVMPTINTSKNLALNMSKKDIVKKAVKDAIKFELASDAFAYGISNLADYGDTKLRENSEWYNQNVSPIVPLLASMYLNVRGPQIIKKGIAGAKTAFGYGTDFYLSNRHGGLGTANFDVDLNGDLKFSHIKFPDGTEFTPNSKIMRYPRTKQINITHHTVP